MEANIHNINVEEAPVDESGLNGNDHGSNVEEAPVDDSPVVHEADDEDELVPVARRRPVFRYQVEIEDFSKRYDQLITLRIPGEYQRLNFNLGCLV